MAHGARDDSNLVQETRVYTLADMAELAARLGSPLMYHRGGILSDQWLAETGTGRLSKSLVGTGAECVLSSNYPGRSGVCMELASSSSENQNSNVSLSLPYPESGSVGCTWVYYPVYVTGSIVFVIWVNSGTWMYYGEIKHVLADSKWYYHAQDGSWIAIQAEGFNSNPLAGYHSLKLVLDVERGEYNQVLLDGHSATLSGVALYRESDYNPPQTRMVLKVIGDGSNPARIALESIVYTQADTLL